MGFNWQLMKSLFSFFQLKTPRSWKDLRPTQTVVIKLKQVVRQLFFHQH